MRSDDAAVAEAIRDRAGGAIDRFYRERGYRPIWIAGGRVGPAAATLIEYLDRADLDGLKPSRYHPDALRDAVARADGGEPDAVADAELRLSDAFSRYVRDQRRSRVKMIWADPALKPKKAEAEAVLRAASFPKSLSAYLAAMGWMSPQYVRLREAAARNGDMAPEERARLRLNMDRARLLPGPWTSHVEVDASSGRLWWYAAGRQVGTMRVVVGAAATQTPMMAGMLRWAILNPYWNVPTYLVRQNVAPKVLAGRSLASLRMEALSDWSADARPLDPAAIDWRAVADGGRELRVRELPGPANSMGKVKFLFPNTEGIYLHDTPNRALLAEPDRHFSNGCIRLEKAGELGRWLLGGPMRAAGRRTEQPVPLPAPVPVYLTYLTAGAAEGAVAFRPDVYGRDG